MTCKTCNEPHGAYERLVYMIRLIKTRLKMKGWWK